MSERRSRRTVRATVESEAKTIEPIDREVLEAEQVVADVDPFEAEADTDPGIRGSRFRTAFEKRSHLHRLHPVRLWRLVLGLGLLAFGIVNIFIPGPGGSVIILASLLVLAGESRLLAALFDRLEVRFARQVDWALGHKIAAMLIVSACAFIAVTLLGYTYTKVR
jgi:hypothetical protein